MSRHGRPGDALTDCVGRAKVATPIAVRFHLRTFACGLHSDMCQNLRVVSVSSTLAASTVIALLHATLASVMTLSHGERARRGRAKPAGSGLSRLPATGPRRPVRRFPECLWRGVATGF